MTDRSQDPRLLVFVGHTIGPGARSGVQRVVMESARALATKTKVDYVTWDFAQGQLRYLDSVELALLFRGADDCPPPNPKCRRADARFVDEFTDGSSAWLLFPEIPYHLDRGVSVFDRVVTQCHYVGILVASVFYDLIPLRDTAYGAAAPDHLDYIKSLTRSDLVLPISHFAGEDLVAFFREAAGITDRQVGQLLRKVRAIPLGVRPEVVGRREGNRAANPSILLLGTVEPRKQQTRVLKVFNDLVEMDPELASWSVAVVGSLHPDSSDGLHAELARNSQISYHAYCPDSQIEEIFARSRFSVFASTHEGFGLPIVESTYRGVPCMTSSFGAMREVAKEGGCLLVDSLSDEAIAEGLLKLMQDSDYLAELARQCDGLVPRTWFDYADDVLEALAAVDTETLAALDGLLSRVQSAAREHNTEAIVGETQGIDWTIVWISDAGGFGRVPSVDRANGTAALAVVLNMSLDWLEGSDSARLEVVRAADIIVVPDRDLAVGLSALMSLKFPDWVAPSAVVVAQGASEVGNVLAQEISIATRMRSCALREAQSDELLAAIGAAGGARWHGSAPILSIVISTFNRALFVEENVRWLTTLTSAHGADVEIVVVDNASDDDTTERLTPFVTSGAIHYVRNPANVGMLGNLRVCTSLIRGHHVWLTGDDDYLFPGALERLLPLLKTFPTVPAVLQNFGVYYRSEFGAADSAAAFCRELVPMAPHSPVTGFLPQREAGSQHDNLYTAIYPLVLRSDVASAMFNFPFNGIPFGTMIECIPTTLYFLKMLQFHELLWIDEVAIAGNAHNSWTHHRPRWHGIIMPIAIRMARDCGFDQAVLRSWLDTQQSLFLEALDIAAANQIAVPMDVEDEFWQSNVAFGSVVTFPRDFYCEPLRAARPWRLPEGAA